MGYGTSERAIKRVQQHLDRLVSANEHVEFEADDPGRLAYYLREAIHAAAKRDPTSPYARLKAKFLLRTLAGKVRAELRDAVPVMALREQMNVMHIPEAADELDVVGAAIKHKLHTMHFPNANEDCAVGDVHSWAKQNGYYVIVHDEDNGITLTKDNPGELAYDPERYS